MDLLVTLCKVNEILSPAGAVSKDNIRTIEKSSGIVDKFKMNKIIYLLQQQI